ncbi:uncharacterized protein (TIGR03083 family) [Kineosphaera limosa]|nr:maleylpyruvate isomerase family mycothiol-dependent enzyme [Kineosphaera limosa]NYE01269.1 uncharacterized protein (TIGR03083 family) [Kineosphaera limosa]
MASDDEQIYAWTTQHRLLLADVLASLAPGQWQAPTLCAGWTVHDLAGHLVQPVYVSFRRFFVVSLRYWGNTDATVAHFARELAQAEPAHLIELLRAHAADQVSPPRVGPMGPFADACIHLRDLARPLGLSADVPAEHWQTLLDYLVSDEVAPALVPPGRLEGVGLRATDADWSGGIGPAAEGTLEALALAATGRSVAADELTGPGADLLRHRLRR